MNSLFDRVGEALVFGSWMLGQALAYAPNVNAAVISASRIMKLLERTPKLNNPKTLPANHVVRIFITFCRNLQKNS